MTATPDPAARYAFQPEITGAPMVSVVFPVYNAERYLAESLSSIRSQSLHDIEIICVNDGSTDSSTQILEKHRAEDSRVIVIKQTNQGVYSARNHGLARARGEFVYFFDSDDILLPDALASAHSAMLQGDLDLCLFSGETFYERKSMLFSFSHFRNLYHLRGSYPGIYPGAELVENMVGNNDLRVVVWLQLIKRSLLVQNAIWFHELRVRMDNLFSFQVQMAAERAKCLPDRLVRRRLHAGSLVTTRDSAADFECNLISIVCMLRHLRAKPSPPLTSVVIAWTTLLFNDAKGSFLKIPASQRRLPVFDDPADAALANFLFGQAQEYVRYQRSPFGRFESALMFLPRKVRGLLRVLTHR